MDFLALTCTKTETNCCNALDSLDSPEITCESYRVFLQCRDSKWFLEGVGHTGLNKMLDGFDDRSAYALCTFALSEGPGTEPILFEGRNDVRAVWSLFSCFFPTFFSYSFLLSDVSDPLAIIYLFSLSMLRDPSLLLAGLLTLAGTQCSCPMDTIPPMPKWTRTPRTPSHIVPAPSPSCANIWKRTLPKSSTEL